MKITTLADQYLKFFAARGASPKTVECYDLTYRQFVGWLVEVQKQQDDLKNFTPDNIEAWSTYLAENGRKASSVNVKLAGLHSLGEYGKKTRDSRGKYHLDENPLDRVYRPKRVKPAEKYLYKAELQTLLAAPKPASVQIALELLVDTALRVSELADAKVSDLTLDGDRVLLAVRVKGDRPRVVTLGADVAGRLLQTLTHREARPQDPLLVNERGDRYTRTQLSEMVYRQARRAGLTRIPVRAHVLRHSVATLASATGADVPTIAAMLNHSNVQTVSRYVHRDSAVDDARERVREALR